MYKCKENDINYYMLQWHKKKHGWMNKTRQLKYEKVMGERPNDKMKDQLDIFPEK